MFLSHRGRATTDNADRARHAIDTALAIDETLPDAHAARALLLGFIDRNWGEAERSVRKALQLAPGDAGILHQAGVCLLITGQFDEAGTLIRRAGDLLDSRTCITRSSYIGATLALLGRHDEAVQWLTKAAYEGYPSYPRFSTDQNLAPLHGHAGFRALLEALRRDWDRWRITL